MSEMPGSEVTKTNRLLCPQEAHSLSGAESNATMSSIISVLLFVCYLCWWTGTGGRTDRPHASDWAIMSHHSHADNS